MDIEKILLIIKIIWYLIKYDFEIVENINMPIYKKNRFVNIYKVDNNTLLKQIQHYSEYYIDPLVIDNFRLPLFNSKGFASKYIMYCISLLPKWFSLENRQTYNIDELPKIWNLNKEKLSYNEELIRSINPKNINKHKIKEIIKNGLDHMDHILEKHSLYFLHLDKKNMTINSNSQIKIIEGDLLNEYQFKTIQKIINKWCPSYKFKLYENYNRIYL